MPAAARRWFTRSNGIVVGATLAGVLLVLYAWRLPPFRSDIEATENAYVRGSITVIAPKVDGYVAEVLVHDFAEVAAGQPLVRLDDRSYVQKLAQARGNAAAQEAHLASLTQTRRIREAQLVNVGAAISAAQAQAVNADAQLARTRADQRRAATLVGDGSLSQREHDQTEGALRQAEAARRQAQAATLQAEAGQAVARQELLAVAVNRRAAEAGLATARAAVRLAEIDVENTVIRAPQAGRVGEVGVKLGQYVAPGTQLMALVPAEVWVIANFKEAQTARMAPGQPATLLIDALGGTQLTGSVERIAPATGSEFSVLRVDNATGNFTKIPQRLPVRIRVAADQPGLARLRPGMSVLARVDTGRSTLAAPDGQPAAR